MNTRANGKTQIDITQLPRGSLIYSAFFIQIHTLSLVDGQATNGQGLQQDYCTSFFHLSIEDNMVNKKSQSIPFSVRLCSDKAAFEVKIQQNIHINIADLGRFLKSLEETDIIADTPHIIIFRSKGAEVTLSRNGRMLIKRIEDEKEAVAVASEILRILSLISEDLQV